MRRWKRLTYYLIINVLVSACTVLVVLNVWARVHPPEEATVEPVAQAGTSVTPGFLPTSSIGAGGEPESTGSNPEEPEEEPTDTVAEEEARAETEYRVQPGDTLGAIAVRFDLTIEEVLEANDLVDPDRLEVGQKLIIPAAEAPEPIRTELPPEEIETVEPTDTPRTPTETPEVVSGEAKVVIDSVVGAGDLDSERVLLKQTGPGQLSLAGWQLSAGGDPVFSFPQLKLFEGGEVTLHTRTGQENASNLYWGLDAPVWESGVEIVLVDNQGEVQATYQVP